MGLAFTFKPEFLTVHYYVRLDQQTVLLLLPLGYYFYFVYSETRTPVAQAGLESPNLPFPSKCWDYRHVLPHQNPGFY